jgi:hypothetical protein
VWEDLLRAFEPGALSISFIRDFWERLREESLPDVAMRLARIRVLNASSPLLNDDPLPMEWKYEEVNLRKKESRKAGPVYSGLHFVALCRSVLSGTGRSLSEILRTVIVTSQRLATHETDRWHLRTVLMGAPSVISVSGIVEAPARPREYYVLKQSDPILAGEFLKARTDWLSHDDPRLTPVLRGFILQAIQFILDPAGFAFCDVSECVLSNPHWQAHLVRTHAAERLSLCPRHLALSRFVASAKTVPEGTPP